MEDQWKHLTHLLDILPEKKNVVTIANDIVVPESKINKRQTKVIKRFTKWMRTYSSNIESGNDRIQKMDVFSYY